MIQSIKQSSYNCQICVCGIIDNQTEWTSISVSGNGGVHRVLYTLPTILFAAYELAYAYYVAREEDAKWSKKCQKIFQFCHQTITVLAKLELFEVSVRLFLQGALAVARTPFDNSEQVAYEYMTQAFSIYEEEISDSKVQMMCVLLVIGTLQQIPCFSEVLGIFLLAQLGMRNMLLGRPTGVKIVILNTFQLKLLRYFSI